MSNGSYLAFLVIGIALVLVDGRLIYRSGLRYLANSAAQRNSAVSMARLVAVLFHLVVLGVLALISVIDINADTVVETVVLRLGVVLIVLAIAHGVTIAILNRMRDRLDAEELTMERAEQRLDNQQPVRDVVSGPPNVQTPPRGLTRPTTPTPADPNQQPRPTAHPQTTVQPTTDTEPATTTPGPEPAAPEPAPPMREQGNYR